MLVRVSSLVSSGEQSRLHRRRRLRDHVGRPSTLLLQAEEASGEVRTSGRVERSEEFPEKVATVQEPVTERDLQYLTIGIVVNATYGRRWGGL